MKKLVIMLLAALVFIPLHSMAQKEGKGDVIDKVQYRVTYKTQAVEDTTRRDSAGNYIYKDDDMRLDIGSKVSKFYSGRKAEFYKWMSQALERGNMIDMRKFTGARPKIAWTVYRNYPQGETSFLDIAYMNNYRISEKTVTPDWSIDSDTCTILGYHCTKAETDFKGRHWTVWYTDDIPLDYGPWKLIGLPGLILKAEDSQRQFTFVAEGLEQIGGKEDITLIEGYKKYEPVTQKQFDEVNRNTTVADTMFKGSEMTVKTQDKDGHELTASETRQKYNKSLPYNPIEIVE